MSAGVSMRLAFTHNLQLSDREDEAEFDTPETVNAISNALRALGHEVELVEVSGAASRVMARLEALNPDLVFNTAEGKQGRFREAFLPALCDRLGIPFTGSDAYVCTLTLDKLLTKMIVGAAGVRVPAGFLMQLGKTLPERECVFPMIVKPNFEGSSMGISVDSIVHNLGDLKTRLNELLARFPAGVLVEQYITGRDVVVPFLEKASPKTGGVLEPASYRYGDYPIYDYELKHSLSHQVEVRVPAEINEAQRKEALVMAKQAFTALGIRDAGRLDFRLGDKGELYFIEANALPSLEPGASLYESAKLAGLSNIEAVLETIIQSAAERYGLALRKMRTKKRTAPKVGLTYNVRKTAQLSEQADNDAEYDTPETIAAIRDAIASYGYQVAELEASADLPSRLIDANVDVVFNIAEGLEGRHREAQVPAVLELLGIPYTGSDPTALSLALDKALAKRLVTQAGFHTPEFTLMTTGKERLGKNLNFPLIVKPVAEGSSKGVIQASVVENENDLRTSVRTIVEKYRQQAIIENFLPGREFTVGLIGERRPRALPPMEIVFKDTSKAFPVYSFVDKFGASSVDCVVKTDLEPSLAEELKRVAKGVFNVLGCRDVARVDLRLDAQGRVNFIECNPLPGLSPGFSDLCVIAERAGIDYRALIGEILAPALRRMRDRKRRTSQAPE